MKPFVRMIAVVILLAGVLVSDASIEAKSEALQARQLQGEAAWQFLAQEGVLEQIAAELASTPPQGRYFEEPAPVTASDAASWNNFGGSVALDGDTVVVGAGSAAYVFTRDGASWSQQQKLVAGDDDGGGSFGTSVALSGDTVVVGAPGADVGGAAYVFTRDGASWSQQQKLVAGGGVDGDRFGGAVALSGDTAVVGAEQANVGGNYYQGAAYVFTRAGTSWSQGDKLVAGDGAAYDNFGDSVALSGDTVIVGAPVFDFPGDRHQGAVYVFTRSGTSWSQGAKLVASDAADRDSFGDSVALSGDTAVVGAPGADVGGAAYVFIRGGASWSQQGKLVAGDGADNDRFGNSVALSGDTAIVGDHYARVGSNSFQGAAYVFTRVGASWSQQQKLVAGDGADGDDFGVSVALSGDTVVVGADDADVGGKVNAGKIYLTDRGPVPWPTTGNNVADDGAEDDRFGVSVAVDGDMAVVGASATDIGDNRYQGAAYVFTRNGPIWVQQVKLLAGDGAAHDWFGISVAVDGDTAVVGAYGGNDYQGAAYVFTRAEASWSQQAKLVAGDGAGGDRFGSSVALDGDTVIVGAWGADVGGNSDQGAAYVFTRSGTSWSQGAKLVAGDGTDYDYFGSSVALDGDTAVVGAYGGNDYQGAAYVFTRDGASWSQGVKLVAGDGAFGDEFGASVALDGDTAVVGAYWAYVGDNSFQGAAYVFTRDGASWSQGAKLVARDGAAHDWFGHAVALSGDTAVVGTDLANVGGNREQGAAYVFTRDGASWSQEAKLLAGDGAAGDWFGQAVALDGDTAVVGADGADVGGRANQGRVYFFQRQPPIYGTYLPLIMR